jgi:hypothetical protein
MSAFCCTRRTLLVNNNTSHAPTITARPTSDEKRRFAELASRRRVSESTLALMAIRMLLEVNGSPPGIETTETRHSPATDRITIRLRPGDRIALNRRAEARGVRTSRYLAALVRAHIAASPPLTVDEVAILKEGVSVLAKLSRALTHTAHSVSQSGLLTPELQKELSLTRAVVAAIEQRMHDLTRSALITWESRYE